MSRTRRTPSDQPGAVPGLATPMVTLGVTGHRVLMDEAAVRVRVAEALSEIKTLAETALAGAGPDLRLTSAPLQLRLYSPLAEGADRVAADAALDAGMRLHCPLPFARTEYARDFQTEASKLAFAGLLDKADRVFELDGDASKREAAYLEVGRVVMRHCDVLLAVWDGHPAKGSGGTAEIVALAKAEGVPVVWIKADGGERAGLLMGSLEAPAVLPLAALNSALRAIVVPPAPEHRTGPGFATYVREGSLRLPFDTWFDQFVNLVLLRGKWPWPGLSRSGELAISRSYWTAPFEGHGRVHAACAPCLEEDVTLAFARADVFASYYAGLYRTTFLANFLLSAFAVGLVVASAGKPNRVSSLAELAAIIVIVTLTVAANGFRWHERWIEYRRLAEQIRPLRILFPLGLTLPKTGLARVAGADDDGSWTDWLTRRVERMLGLPDVAITPDYIFAVRTFAAEAVLEEQIQYHERNEKKLSRVDERLHWIGMILFVLTALACGYDAFEIFRPKGSEPTVGVLGHWNWRLTLVALSGIMPAVGSALLGIRNVGEFARLELRSKAMAEGLRRRRSSLEGLPSAPITRAELTMQMESFAAELTAETTDWRTLILVRRIELPG